MNTIDEVMNQDEIFEHTVMETGVEERYYALKKIAKKKKVTIGNWSYVYKNRRHQYESMRRLLDSCDQMDLDTIKIMVNCDLQAIKGKNRLHNIISTGIVLFSLLITTFGLAANTLVERGILGVENLSNLILFVAVWDEIILIIYVLIDIWFSRGVTTYTYINEVIKHMREHN